MATRQIPDSTAPRAPGRVERALTNWLMREALVTAVETLSPRFRLIDLAGEALRDAPWAAGNKLQMMLGAGLLARTYTPMRWDRDRGTTRILAYAHGDGPGGLWSGSIAAGDTVRLFGPRKSLDLAALPPATRLFGDETSFALAATLAGAHPPDSFLFEVHSRAEAGPVIDALGLSGATLVERAPEDAHLAAIEADFFRTQGHAAFILTGKATSIQRLSRTLKAAGAPPAAIRAKAYWAPGKRGLD